MGPPFISFRLLSEGGLGAPGTEVQGFAGNRAPSPGRRAAGNGVYPIKLSALYMHNPICLEI